MVKFAMGNMLADEVIAATDLTLITTNASVNERGALVMGRGVARQARDAWPGLDLALGKAVAARTDIATDITAFIHQGRSYTLYPDYCLLISPDWPEKRIGAFQVKSRFFDPADLLLIQAGLNRLRTWCRIHPDAQVHLNFPGIGWGHRERSEVQPLLDPLPDTVTIWELPPF